MSSSHSSQLAPSEGIICCLTLSSVTDLPTVVPPMVMQRSFWSSLPPCSLGLDTRVPCCRQQYFLSVLVTQLFKAQHQRHHELLTRYQPVPFGLLAEPKFRSNLRQWGKSIWTILLSRTYLQWGVAMWPAPASEKEVGRSFWISFCFLYEKDGDSCHYLHLLPNLNMAMKPRAIAAILASWDNKPMS